MIKKAILFWFVFSLFVLGVGFGISALVNRQKSKNPDDVMGKPDAAQSEAVSEAISHYSKTSAANLDAVVKELDNIRPIHPGQTKPVE